jgi:hypothetical protein
MLNKTFSAHKNGKFIILAALVEISVEKAVRLDVVLMTNLGRIPL